MQLLGKLTLGQRLLIFADETRLQLNQGLQPAALGPHATRSIIFVARIFFNYRPYFKL